ncbi:hypothetical protein [Litorihabitans aurantiacus]|uniref:Uncharacterized protein n=1 Tax=Litorihabitans aurantiacus TaxID=1930061 RepID=A0AA37UWU7_9MICO|nr:hypothetical protein [Litorihabitans aurantiacus]GMA30877.1 hypothetical protein GCM10025875_08690 [Litorihabitans aurantiacus]
MSTHQPGQPERPDSVVGERRRRRLEAQRAAAEAAATTGSLEAVPGDEAQEGDGVAAPVLSRRQLREQRERRLREQEAERGGTAGDGASDVPDAPVLDVPTPAAPGPAPTPGAPDAEPESTPSAPAARVAPVRVARADRTASLPPVPPAREAPATSPADDDAYATPSGSAPNRRSMRDRRTEGPAGPAGRGERVPPSRPVVRTPAAAQGIRRVDETGALSGVTSTRATEDSPVEVTGPIDWSASLAPVPASPAPEQPRPGSGATSAPLTPSSPSTEGDDAVVPPVVPPRSTAAPEPATVAPARRSVLGAGRSDVDRPVSPVGRADVEPAAGTHAWESVTGEGRGAAVPLPGEAQVPDVEGVFDVVPDPVTAGQEVVDLDRELERRPLWQTFAAIVGFALVGVALGVGVFFLIS